MDAERLEDHDDSVLTVGDLRRVLLAHLVYKGISFCNLFSLYYTLKLSMML